ncbi:acyl-CoA dehydrogenase [Runella slithyformis]|uniref:Butyryl-CoA dehydrogenase n=1 Tax=Runella slithyformis (strain ATCC 29530 / DSM 19594 / LMG 11500 / NCIMB 11436 / LSU 4) TaxID=761193 RepID=A0A7U3ZG67_RUNSL|nr:acyl-CoA dehydrogenase [Runella slithyformis]AEI46628.1 Butyryl-CoA dehydrogenase [Runella slithyformis DSM 19594]
MPSFFSKRDLHFHLYELLNVEQLTDYPYFKDHQRESFDMILDAAEQIADKMLRPLLTEMDRKEPQLINGTIRVHEGMKAVIRRFGDDGWINAGFSYEEGGQQLPVTVQNAAAFIFQAANYSASVYPFLTTGAANLIRTFGSEALIKRYTPLMYSGRWQGTMALTEPNAGSSLSDISTSAEPTEEEGVYSIQGQKIFISCGDHDACENVVHLLLAKIKGSPAGTKGISLFVVPKKRITDQGLIDNGITTAGVYHKMGYKGAPIAHLMFGSDNNCLGYLVGEPHKGLSYMFQMMNEARVGVGMNAAAIGTAAYYASLAYAKERPQGRPVTAKDPTQPQTLIIHHADVKRMLLFQKSVVEGSLSLLLQCGFWADLAHVSEGETKERAEILLDMLTPIAKSYPSEMCCQTTSAAVQILGGAGYTTDFPVEQYYREARIHPIHEGTTGIHGMDLLGRKLLLHGGKGLHYLTEEIQATIDEGRRSSYPDILNIAAQLQTVLERVDKVTASLLTLSPENKELFLADATLYLEFFGIVTMGWQWLKQAIQAQKSLEHSKIDGDLNFYRGKLAAADYFFEYEVVKTVSLAQRLMSHNRVTVEMQPDWF